MAVEQFDDAVVIDGSQDTTQLTVQGHSTQTEPLQVWENSAGDEQAQITGDGRLQVGSFDSGMMATDDSLIEAHRDEADTSKPKRGLHLLGEITGTLDSLVAWAVQELVLKGTGGISAIHSALRVRLTNENTGTMDSGADLRGADVEVINNGGTNGNHVPQMTGLQVSMINQADGFLDEASGVKVHVNNDGTLTGMDTLLAVRSGSTATQTDEELLVIGARGYDGTALSPHDIAQIKVQAEDDFTNLSQPTSLSLYTTPEDSVTPQKRLHVAPNGAVGVGTETPQEQLHIAGGNLRIAANQPELILDDQDLYTDSNYRLTHGSGNDLQFKFAGNWGSSVFMVMRWDGRVGIGTTNPTALLDVNGALVATSKSFVIDHPLDPEQRDLYHASVEAPRHDLLYRGQVALVDGEAHVDINQASNLSPGTFEALTQHVQVFLQNSATFDGVRGTIEDGVLHIQSEEPTSNHNVDWLIVAERSDASIRADALTDASGHLIPEQNKPEPTDEDLAQLEPRQDETATDDYEEVVDALIGKRGYPRQPQAFGRERPKRSVKAVDAASPPIRSHDSE